MLIQSGSPDNCCQDPTGYLGSLLSRWYTLPPILRNLANKQTNRQIDKQKNLSTQRFELSTLAFLAQCSYRLSFRAVLIWLILSGYYYQITFILDLIEILIQSGSQDNCYQDPTGYLGSWLSRWYTLPPILRNLANKQTNRQTDKQKNLSTQKFELSTLAFLAQCSYRLSYRAVLIWLLLSDYYYQIDKIFWPHRCSNFQPSLFLAQCSYRLSYRDILIWLLLSHYFYQITVILDLIEILIQSGSPDNCYQDPTGYSGS